MDRRSNVARLETVAHGNGYFGDGFSRPFSNGGCPRMVPLLRAMILTNPSRSSSFTARS